MEAQCYGSLPIKELLMQTKSLSHRHKANYQTNLNSYHSSLSDQMARPGDLPVPAVQAALLLGCMLPLLTLRPCCAQQPPSPGYYPSAMYRSVAFSEDYRTLWGSQHQTLSADGKSLTLWMDSSSGDRLSIYSLSSSDHTKCSDVLTLAVPNNCVCFRQRVQVGAGVPERLLRRVDQGAAGLHRRRQHGLLCTCNFAAHSI